MDNKTGKYYYTCGGLGYSNHLKKFHSNRQSRRRLLAFLKQVVPPHCVGVCQKFLDFQKEQQACKSEEETQYYFEGT
jgi:hypothetical protein